jgi:hypothetical protein
LAIKSGDNPEKFLGWVEYSSRLHGTLENGKEVALLVRWNNEIQGFFMSDGWKIKERFIVVGKVLYRFRGVKP